jgi:hypothetical protein
MGKRASMETVSLYVYATIDYFWLTGATSLE